MQIKLVNSFFFFGKNPTNKNLSILSPVKAIAEVMALGPGIDIILIPLILAFSINSGPGSETPIVPASTIKAASCFSKQF